MTSKVELIRDPIELFQHVFTKLYDVHIFQEDTLTSDTEIVCAFSFCFATSILRPLFDYSWLYLVLHVGRNQILLVWLGYELTLVMAPTVDPVQSTLRSYMHGYYYDILLIYRLSKRLEPKP